MTSRLRAQRPGGSVPAALLLILAACADADGDALPQVAPPASEATPAPSGAVDPLAEIAAFVPGPGQSLDVIELRDERGELSLRRGVLRDADGMINHGHFQRWHPNGQMAEDGHYLAGARHGRYTVIADSGLKETEIEYRRGVKHGEALAWGKLGVLRERARYVDGVLDGDFEGQAGGSRVRGRYAAGVEVGLWTWTDLEGRKQREGEFALGKRTGTWRTWHEGLQLATEEPYVEGVLEGLAVEYDSAGVRRAEREYKAGQPHGESREFHPDGSPAARIAYSEGVPHGPQSRWYENGVLQMEGTMERGKRSGPWIYNKLDGTRNEAWSGTYEADQRVGD
jgi:uncharacterized protein